MKDDSLIQALPDWVGFIRRDGTVLREVGGRRLGLGHPDGLVGKTLTQIWPEDVAALLLHNVRRALRERSSSDVQFAVEGQRCEARIAAHGRDRTLCVIRQAVAPEQAAGGAEMAPAHSALEWLSDLIAAARLRERPLAVCLIYLQGLGRLGRVLDYALIDRIARAQLARVRASADQSLGVQAERLGESGLLAVIGHADRTVIQAAAERMMRLLAEPVAVEDAAYACAASIGIALLGEDGTEGRGLLESARCAMQEARRGSTVQFYSDSLPFRTIERLDLRRELHHAVQHDQLALRFSARHALPGGPLTAIQSYLRWHHPIRGEVAPAEFLPIAESTGLGCELSRWLLRALAAAAPGLSATHPGACLSFGALRAHVIDGSLARDLERFLAASALEPHRLELRIAERTLSALADPVGTLAPLARLGIRLAVDEVGRGFTSVPRLAALPLNALQLDRRLALAAFEDRTARCAAGATLAMARALGLSTISPGIDDNARCELFVSLGCEQGSGDLFGPITVG